MKGGSLEGKIALVTGGSRGIGRATALRLAAEGALVGVHYSTSFEAAKSVLHEIEVEGGMAFSLGADLADTAMIPALFNDLDCKLASRGLPPRLDILVNNAGIGPRAVIEDVSEAELDHVIALNLKAPFFAIQQASRRMGNGGSIINVSSNATRFAFPLFASYAPTKAALEALTLLLAQHFGPRGIRVNAVLPGATATEMNPRALDPASSGEVAKSIALGRIGRPDDIASVIAFLASDSARWITGERIAVSGGQRL